MDNRGNGIDYLEEKSNYAGFENIVKQQCKNTCEMSIFVQERKQILDDLHNEFSRYKCYEHADKYLREYAVKHGIKLEE